MQDNPIVLPYHAYVLRLWPEQQNGDTKWRFTLLEPKSGARLGFSTLDALVEHLRTVTEEGDQSVGS